MSNTRLSPSTHSFKTCSRGDSRSSHGESTASTMQLMPHARLSKDKISPIIKQEVTAEESFKRDTFRSRYPSKPANSKQVNKQQVNIKQQADVVRDWPNYFAEVAWALGRSKHHHRIWGWMSNQLIHRHPILQRMKPEELLKVACGYAMVKVYDKRLFKLIAKRAFSCLPAFSPQQLSQLAWSFAEVHHLGEDGLLDELSRRAEERLGEFEPNQLVQLIKALTDLDYLSMDLLLKFTPRLLDHLGQLKTASLLELLGSLATIMAKRPSSLPQEPAKLSDNGLAVLLRRAVPVFVERAARARAKISEVAAGVSSTGSGPSLSTERLLWEGAVLAFQVEPASYLIEEQDRSSVLAALERIQVSLSSPSSG